MHLCDLVVEVPVDKTRHRGEREKREEGREREKKGGEETQNGRRCKQSIGRKTLHVNGHCPH